MVSFEKFVKSMTSSLSYFKVSPSFCFPNSIPYNLTTSQYTPVWKRYIYSFLTVYDNEIEFYDNPYFFLGWLEILFLTNKILPKKYIFAHNKFRQSHCGRPLKKGRFWDYKITKWNSELVFLRWFEIWFSYVHM